METTVSNISQDQDEELREQILTNKRRTGRDPSLLLDLLHELVERESWKRRGEDGWTLLRYVQTPFDEGGLGFDRKEVENIIQFWHKYEKDGLRHDPEKAEEMEQLQAMVRDLLTPELGEHGINQHETGNGDSYNNLQGRGAEYLAAPIKRNRPDVHERMKESEFQSVRQVAIEAGIIEDIRTKQIRETDDPKKMEAKIRHVHGDEVASQLFSGGAGPEEDGRPENEDPLSKGITERDDAPSEAELAGPPQTKDPDSEEYAWQKAGLLQLYAESIRGSLQDWEEVTEEARREAIHETLGYDTSS